MRICPINSSSYMCSNKNSVKTNHCKYQHVSNLNFGATANNFAQAIDHINMTTTRAQYSKFIEIAERLTNNEYQLKFLEKFFTTDICPLHPATPIKGHSIPIFQDILCSIKTEENLNAKSYALDFLMKRPKHFEEYWACRPDDSTEDRLDFIRNFNYDCQKDFYEFIDQNYDRLSQNANFNKRLTFLVNNIKTKESIKGCQSFLTNIMAKYQDDSFKDIDIGDYVAFAIRSEFGAKYVEDMLPIIKSDEERYKFFDYIFIHSRIQTENQMKLAEELYNKVYNKDSSKRIELHLAPYTLMGIPQYDDNISLDELLAIDKKYWEKITANSSKWHVVKLEADKFLNNLYTAYSTVEKRYGHVDYNEYSRQFLYNILDAEPDEFFYKDSYGILTKNFLKSIKTPEQIVKANKFYQTLRKNFNETVYLSYFYPKLLFEYNYEVADVMNIEKNWSKAQHPEPTSSGHFYIPICWGDYKTIANNYLKSIGKQPIPLEDAY